jgi:hypothetical protein
MSDIHDVLETGSVSVIGCMGRKDPTQLGTLEDIVSLTELFLTAHLRRALCPVHLMTERNPVPETSVEKIPQAMDNVQQNLRITTSRVPG